MNLSAVAPERAAEPIVRLATASEFAGKSGGFYKDAKLGIDPAPGGGPGNSQIVIADPKQWTPEQFAQAQCSTCPASPFENVTLGGEPVQRTQVGGGGVPFTITWYFVEHNGKLIALAIHDPETLKSLDDVIQSIRFQ